MSWICESKSIMDFFIQQYSSADSDELLIADFASGENDKIPTFIHKVLPDFLPQSDLSTRRTITYSTDLHGLRIDSLYAMFDEQGISDCSRAVYARLESMTTEAAFRQEQHDYLLAHQDNQTSLDRRIVKEKRTGEDVFDLGFLNNDVIGYLFEYYKAYTDALASLTTVQKTMRLGGLLVVTQPCSLYPVDNLEVLRQVGFSFIEGLDIDTNTGKRTSISESVDLDALSRMGHYTFFVLKKT